MAYDFFMHPKSGVYRHYKGNEYQVIGTGIFTETDEEVVIYRALYGERGLFVRPLKMFIENVEFEGKIVPRFFWLREAEG